MPGSVNLAADRGRVRQERPDHGESRGSRAGATSRSTRPRPQVRGTAIPSWPAVGHELSGQRRMESWRWPGSEADLCEDHGDVLGCICDLL